MSFLQTTSYGHPAAITFSGPPSNVNLCAWATPIGKPVNSKTQCLKRRVTANCKERRRTLSINNAFAELRDRIPNVPSDTKLSKIKTLRLATSYIAYLTSLLASEDGSNDSGKQNFYKGDPSNLKTEVVSEGEQVTTLIRLETVKRLKGAGWPEHTLTTLENSKGRKASIRTGWPQDVWALELKHDTSS